jgi:SPP1 gp7 family putative phage head morphogenesis protein
LSPEAVRQILLDEGEIGEEIFKMLQSQPDVTPEVTVTDEEEAEDQQAGTETVQEDNKAMIEKPPPKMAHLHMKLERAMAEAMDDGLKKAWRLVRERIFGTKQKVLTSPADLLADADLWKQIRDILLGKMQGVSLDVATSVLAMNQKLGLAIDMDRVNTVLLEYTRNYSNEWWSKLEESTRDGLREALTTWEQQGLGTRGFPDLVKAIEPYFGESRAHNIAMTETTKLLDESNRLSEMSAGITEQKWYTSMDSRVCDICEPLNNRVFPIEQGPYPVDDTHIGCRCERIGVT